MIKANYGSMEEKKIRNGVMVLEDSSGSDSDSASDSLRHKIQQQMEGFWDEIVSADYLLLFNEGLPVTLLLFCCIELADEVLISSCSMVVRRYFNRNASAAGYFVAR